MSSAPKKDSFGLEELEPRVLLSANLTAAATAATGLGTMQSDHVIHEVAGTKNATVTDSLAYQPGGAGGDMFAGMSSQAVETPASTAHPATPDSSGQVLATAPTAQNPASNPAAGQTGVTAVEQNAAAYTVSPAAAASMATSTADTLAITSVDHSGLKAFELTTTLKGANGPPHSTALTLQDLHDYIADLLASASASFHSEESLGSVSLGGFLQLDGVQLVVDAVLSNGVWGGSVAISATGATLFPGKNFSGAITATSGNAITGSYSIGSGYSLTVTNSANLVINVGEALKITATGVTIGYDPNGADNQTVATITTGSVTSQQFTGMPSATLANFRLRADGFSFDAFTLTSSNSASPAIGNLITTTSATLSVTNFNVSFGYGSTAASMSGTVSLTLSGLKLFPAGSLVDFEATSVTAAYDFGTTFDGTTPTGTLSLTISGFKLKLGEAMNLTATGNVVLTPGQATMATIASASLSSPQFTGLGTISVTNVVIRQDGFSLGSITWQSSGSVGISDIITADSVTVSITNFSLSYGTIPKFTGSISVSASNVVLFGGISILNLHLGDISGLYDFGTLELPTLPRLKLNFPNGLDIPLGDFLTIHLPTFDLSPGFLSMIKLPHVDLIPNLFTGLPKIDFPDFELTQLGFSLGNFSFTLPTAVQIGNFLSLANITINVANFSISKVTPFVTGVVTVTLGDLSLFPGTNIISSTFTNLRGVFDFSATAVVPGRFQFLADSISLVVGGQLTITAQNIVITPALNTLATIGTATLTFPLLEGLHMDLSNLVVRRDGFTIASASATISTVNLGGILSLTTPTVTLTDIDYAFGGTLTGTLGFSASSAKLALGGALETSASSLTGSYNLSTGRLNVTLSSFGLNIADFASISATGASITYDPQTNGTAEILVGITGVEAFLGTGTGANRVGVELTSGSLALAIFKAANGTKTYALEAKGTVALLGLPDNTLSASGTISFRKSTVTTAVDETITVSGTDLHLVFAGVEESATGTDVSLSVGSFVSISGDFSFRQFTPDNGTTNYIVVGVTSLDATVAAGDVKLTITGASLGLLVKAGATPAASGYALVVNGGTDSLTGVPDVSLSASGLSVRVRHGFDPSTVTGLPTTITTPSGSVNMSFAGLGSGTGDVTDVQGTITLTIANFVSITGNFGFQQFTSGGTTYMAIGATAVSIVLGTSTTNVTVSSGSLGLILAPAATSGGTGSYALQASGNVALNGVTNLTLSGNNLTVRARKGLDLSGKTVPSTIQTSGGAVTLNFAGLPAGSSEVFDIKGHLTLAVTGFGSLEGDFGIQSFTSGISGQQTIAIGVSAATIKLGTDDVNLTVSNATFGAIIRPGLNSAPATYALQATASSVALNGVDPLGVTGTDIQVRIRSGLDLATLTGVPTTIQTSGASVTLDFSGLPAGSSNVMDVQGHLTLSVGTFVSLTGDFGFQSYAVGNDNYLAIGAKNLTATLSAGPVNLTIANASVGVIVKQGTAATQNTAAVPTSYALIAKGSSNPADTTLSGGPAFTLSASNLLVRVRSGLDVTNLPSGIPSSVHTSGGDVTFDFAGLGSGTSAVTDIQGHLKLTITDFVSLEGDFGFQKFGTGVDAALAIGAKNVTAILGSPTGVNVTIGGASLGVLVKGDSYALIATGTSNSLNGVQGLSITGTGLKVRVKKNLDPATLTNAPNSVLVAGGQSVALDFTGLGAADVTEISGSISIDIADFVSLSGTFSFTQSSTAQQTKILVGGTGISAFVGSPDKSFGVEVTGASFGLAIYRGVNATGSTYALQASATNFVLHGLGDITLSGNLKVSVNTTGAAVNETPTVGPGVVFTTGTAIKSIGGSLTIGFGTVSLVGDFSFTQTTANNATTLKIGVADVHTATGGSVKSDSNVDYALTNGTLGIVSYSSGGYVLVASATATLASDLGGATATLNIRRNTTTAAHTESIVVGATTISLSFTTAAETAANYTKIVITNAAFTIGSPKVIEIAAGQIDPEIVNGGAKTTSLAQVSMTLYAGTQVILNITAGTADYTTFTAATTLHGRTYAVGDTDVYLTNVSFSVGGYVTFTAASINLQSYTVSGTTTHAFAFGSAAISFLMDGKAIVTLGGTANFHFNATDGFKMDSFSNPIVSFMGQALPASNPTPVNTAGLVTGAEGGSYRLADAPPPTTVTLGPITLINPSISLDKFEFKSAGGTTVNLTATVHLTVGTAKIGADASPTRATISNLDISFKVGATFDPLHLTDPPTLTISDGGFKVTAGAFTITIGDFLTIAATNLTLNPTAGAAEDLISFTSLSATLKIGSFQITGEAKNFAIEGDGSFLAKANFSVSLEVGEGAEGGMNWPAWLPLKHAKVELFWTNFNAHPTQFLIQLSADVQASIGTISLSGGVRNAVIDPQLLFEGKFPIISIDSVTVGASGQLFGGTISGTLLAGIVRFDSNGAIIDGLGHIEGTTNPAVGTVTNVFYAGVAASIQLAGMAGFSVRIGFSDFGPLQVYLEAGAPIPLGPTGLFLSNFRAGVSFGQSFPSLTFSNPLAASDALQLRRPGFSTPNSLTAGQWETQLRSQVVTLYRANTAHKDFADLDTPILITAGATIYAANANAFRVDADLVMDTSGRFLIVGSATIGNSLSVGVKMFTDLSKPTDEVKVLYLMEVPTQTTPTPTLPPVYSVYGVATFSLNGSVFTISVAGAVDFNVLGGLRAHAEATLTLTFASNSFTLTLSNGSFSIPTISTSPLGTAAGTVTIETAGGTTNIWGGFLLNTDLGPLKNMGIDVSGQVFVKLNTTSVQKSVTLAINGGQTVLDLKAASFSLFITGTGKFSVNGQQVFELQGTLAIDINPTSLSIFVVATLKMGPNSSTTILTFNASGLIYVQLVEDSGMHPGFAAKLTLTMSASLPNVAFNMNWLLVMNTTSGDITYFIPAAVPGGPTVATVMGPDYASSNPNATVSYETTVNGKRALVIPGGPPGTSLTNYSTWTAGTNTPYLVIIGRGNLTIGSAFYLTGAIAIRASQGVFTLDTNASLALKANGNTVFTFNVVGGLQISSAGVAASLTVSMNGNAPSNMGFAFGGSLTFQLQLNTTGAIATVNGVQVSAGTNNFYGNIHITGNLTFLGGVVTLSGSFDLTVTGTSLQLAINADITFLRATLHASGFAGIYYDSAPGLALSIQLSLPGGAEGIAPVAAIGSNFVIKGTFTLQINTTSQIRNGINPGFRVAVTNIGVYLFGFNLTGSLSISMSSAGFAIDVQNLTLNLFGFATVTLTGYYHPDGQFRFTGTASFQFGNHTFGIGGSISVTISNSGFSASVSGWVAAFGVEISGGGGITISGSSVDIDVFISVVIIPAVHIHTPEVGFNTIFGHVTIIPEINIDTPEVRVTGTAHFHLGSTAPAPAPAAVTPPPAPPAPPALAGVSNGQLKLFIGNDVGLRNNPSGLNTPAQAAENYTLTLGANSSTIIVTALGITQTYTGVTSIFVTNTAGGNDTITIDGAITLPVNITLGSGSNTITTGSGAATVSVTGNAANVISTGNSANITITGGGNNVVSAGSGTTLNITGGGANRVTVNGNTGSNNLTIAGNGGNQLTVIGTSPTTISINSASFTQVTTGGGATTLTMLGAGGGQIATGSGATTINDKGTGGLAVKGGPGGGTYFGGLNSSNVAFGSKGSSSVTTTFGNFTVQVSGYSSYSLSNASLNYGGFVLGLSGVSNVTLIATSTTAANQFTLSGWTGSATLQGAGSTNTFWTVPGASAAAVNYTLSNTQLSVTGGVSQTITLSGIQTANLTGASTGSNTYDVSSWTGNGQIGGQPNTTNTLVATNDIATFTLSDNSFARSDRGTLNLSNVQLATLTGGAGTNTFVVGTQAVGNTAATNWTGNATLDGKGGADTYTLSPIGSGAGTVNVTDTGSTGTDVLNINAPRTVFVTSTQVRVGTQRTNYSGVETLAITGTAAGLSFNVQSTNSGTSTSIATGSSTAVVSVGSNAGVIPVVSGNLNGIAGALSISGGGTMAVDDTSIGTGTRSGTLTATTITGFGMGPGITYAGVSALTLSLGNATYTVTVNEITASTLTTINAGTSAGDTVNATFATNFNGTLNLAGFEHGTVTVGSNFNGTLNVTAPGHLETVTIGSLGAVTGSLVAAGRLNAGAIDTLNVGSDLAGIVTVTGQLGTLKVGHDVSGTVTESGTMTLVSIGHDLTTAGTITVTGSITTMTVGHNLAGHLNVSSNLGSLSVTGDLNGTVSVSGALTTLAVTGNVSGTVTETGTMNLVTIGGALSGSISASNSGDPTEVPLGAYAPSGNVVTMTVGQVLSGTLTVTGNLGSLTVGTPSANANLTGTVTVHGALTSLTVNGDVSGQVKESGAVTLIKITGSLTPSGLIQALNSSDPAAQRASITEIAVTLDVAGQIIVSGRLAKLTVGRDVTGSVTEAGTITELTVGGSVTGSIKALNSFSAAAANITTATISGNVSGTITVQGTLSTLKVTGDVSGTVTEAGVVTLLTIGGSLTSTGTINAVNTTAASGQITTITIAHNLAGHVNVSGALGSMSVGTTSTADKLSGNVAVGGTLGTLTVTGDITGQVTVSGNFNTGNISRHVTGTIAVTGTLGSLTVGGDVSGHVTVGGNFTTGNVTGNISGTVDVTGTLATLTVGGNVSGSITEHGTTTLIDIGGSLTSTGVITATNPTATAGNIVTLTLGADLAGTVSVSGALTTLTVGNNVSGVVTESGTINQITIHGSLLLVGTAPGVTKGTINAVNATASLGQIVTMTVDHNLAGALNVSGNVGTLNVGTGSSDDLSGTVEIGGSLGTLDVHGNVSGLVHVVGNFTTGSVTGNVSGIVSVDATLVTLTVGGNVSGTILEHGTTTLIDISGSLTSTGKITATNATATAGNIETLHIGVDLAGTVVVSGALDTLKVDHDVSGAVTESGTITLLTIGGSLTGTGTINAVNATAGLGQIVTMTVGRNLAGTLNVSGDVGRLTIGTVTSSDQLSGLVQIGGSLGTLTVTGDISGRVNVGANFNTGSVTGNISGIVDVTGTLTTLTVGANVSGSITEHGTTQLIDIGGSLTASGHITATNPTATSGNIVKLAIGVDLAGTVLVSGALTTLTVGNNVSGSVTESGTIDLLTIGGSLTSTGVITAFNAADPTQVPLSGGATLANINTFTIGADLAGTVTVTGTVTLLTVGGDLSGTVAVHGALTTLKVTGNVSGSVTESGTVALLTIGGSLTGSITAKNTQDSPQVPPSGQVTIANITTLTIGHNVSGTLTVTGNVVDFTVGTTLADSLSGTVTVGNTLTNLTVTGDVSGSVTESGIINTLTIGGSLTATGKITAANTNDSFQVIVGGTAPLANINTFTIGADLAGTVKVTGTVTLLTVGGNLSGTVTVQGALTTLKVTGNVSGLVSETGTIDLLTIGGSLTASGKITAANTADPAQVPLSGGATVANINTFTLGADLAGTVTVTGTVTLLTVGGNLSGTVAVQGALTTLKVTGNVSGSVTESGTVVLLTIGGSLTGSITAKNTQDSGQVPPSGQVTIANITTLTVGHNLSGTLTVTGNVVDFTVGTTLADSLSGTVTIGNTLTNLTVTGDVSGSVTESGTVSTLTIGGSLTSTGKITAANTNDPFQVIVGGGATFANIVTFTIGADLAGKVTVTGTATLLTVGGNLSGTVAVQGALTTLKVTGNVSGNVTESGVIDLLTIGGSLTSTGKITAANTVDPLQVPLSGGATVANINTFTIGADLAGTVTVTGTITLLTVGGNLSGIVAVQGALTTLKVTGNVSGSVTESGTVVLLTIGGSLTGSITAKNTQDSPQVPPTGQVTIANITTLTIGHNLSGTLAVTGNVVDFTVGTTLADSLSGTVTIGNTLTNLTVTGDVSGSVTESGKVNTLTIGGSLTSTGKITAANTNDPAQLPAVAVPTFADIATMTVGQNLAGQVKVTGNLTALTVGGNLSGIVFVQGTLTTLKVIGDVSGAVTESGTINLLQIGGSLTATGTIRAFNNLDPSQLPPVDPPWLGNIVTMTVGVNLAGQVTVSGDLNTLTVGGNLSGSVLVQNTLTTLAVTGDVSGSVIESGTINSLTIGGSLTVTGLIKAVNIVPTLGNIVTFTIGRDFAGTVIVSGNLHSLAIVGGSMTPTGRLTVGSLDTMTIGPDQLSVGQNMAGVITVLGTLQTLRVAGGTPGTIIAGHIGTISVYGGFGPVVLNVTENGIQRKIELASPNNPYPLPDPTTVAGSPYVNLQFFYESGLLANPQVTARLTNGVSTARSQYDLSFITYNNTAKFNLARLDTVGISGVRNVVIEGDLLTAVTAQAAAFFRSTPAAMPGGVRLSYDDIAGVSIRDFAPNGYIQAHTIMAVAFGSHTESNGRLETGANAAAGEAERLLTPDTKIVQSADTFRVAFADQPNFAVGLFFAVRTTGGNGSFEAHVVALTVQSVVTANAAGTGNIVTPSNVARGAATALVKAMPTYDKDGKIRDSVIQTVAIRGDGASIATKEYISQSITSTGPLGDITLTSDQGITDITAPSIFGSIDGKKITGVVQTTGLRTNPIDSTVTTVNADLGRVYVAFTNKGVPYVTTSFIDADIEGSVIVRGTLISTITHQKLSGLLAVQGDWGVMRTFGATTLRLGGGTINGTLDGTIVVLGSQIGDVTIHGGFKARTYAVAGDVLGNLSIDGSSKDDGLLVVGGKIGDAALGTALTHSGSNQGIIATYGAIRFAKTAPKGYIFNNVGATAGDPSAAAIRAVFTQGGVTLKLDVAGLDLQGLSLILADLARVVVNSSGKLSGPIP